MSSIKDLRTEEQLKHLAADFLQRESNRQSLVTVTGVILGHKLETAKILITVLPEDKEEVALDFARRKRTEFREYVKENSKLHRIPFFDFEIDFGEKNRQRIDEISNNL
jgi:ribosome-binding factor A